MATLYYVVYPSASGTPTAAQVKAAWIGTAVASGSETSPAVSTSPFTFGADATGLTPATSYKLAVVWSDGATDSNVAESAAFVTAFNLSASPIAITGAVALSGDLAYLVPSLALSASPIALSGALSAAGDAQIGSAFNLAASALALSGAATASGDVQITTAIVLDLAASSLALSGSLAAAGNIGIGSAFNLSAAVVSVAGAAAVAGNLSAGTGLNLSANPIAVAGLVALSGNIASSNVPAPQLGADRFNYEDAMRAPGQPDPRLARIGAHLAMLRRARLSRR